MAINTITTPRPSWAPVYTASKWTTLLEGMRDITRRKQALTNAEAASFIREWHNVSESNGPLWSQFAAAAYGYDPAGHRPLVRTAVQGSKPYPLTDAIWHWAGSIASELDTRATQPPRIAVDRDTFMDPVWFGKVLAEVKQDGGARAPTKTKRVVSKRVAPKHNSGELVLWALLAWMLLTPNRRTRGTGD